MFTKEQVEKIGNTIIFLTNEIHELSKIKLLKLLYILDEISIKKSGIPFLNLEYKVWKFGPVASDFFVEFSSEPSMLKNFIIRKTTKEGQAYIAPRKEFNDDEFTQNELDLLSYIVDEFGTDTAGNLVKLTHRKLYPWYNAAVRNSVYELLMNEKISSTDIKVDMKELIIHDERKMRVYENYLAHC